MGITWLKGGTEDGMMGSTVEKARDKDMMHSSSTGVCTSQKYHPDNVPLVIVRQQGVVQVRHCSLITVIYIVLLYKNKHITSKMLLQP